MRLPAFILGVILLVAGGLIAAGVFKFQSTEKVLDMGPIEVTKTDTKSPPINLGWVLMGVGAVVLVIGAASKK